MLACKRIRWREILANKVKCTLCHKKGKLEQHRIKPGGSYEDPNVMIVCQPCHQELHRILYDRNLRKYRKIIRMKAWMREQKKRNRKKQVDEKSSLMNTRRLEWLKIISSSYY